jgi:hypothetical protein
MKPSRNLKSHVGPVASKRNSSPRAPSSSSAHRPREGFPADGILRRDDPFISSVLQANDDPERSSAGAMTRIDEQDKTESQEGDSTNSPASNTTTVARSVTSVSCSSSAALATRGWNVRCIAIHTPPQLEREEPKPRTNGLLSRARPPVVPVWGSTDWVTTNWWSGLGCDTDHMCGPYLAKALGEFLLDTENRPSALAERPWIEYSQPPVDMTATLGQVN